MLYELDKSENQQSFSRETAFLEDVRASNFQRKNKDDPHHSEVIDRLI
jgi:hypothetical protein